MADENTPKFYELDLQHRLKELSFESGVPLEELRAAFVEKGLSAEEAGHMVENAVGVFNLPFGIARNFLVNGRDVLVPMAVEEPSVIAGASFMAKLARSGGGFTATTTPPEMIGQLQLLDLNNPDKAAEELLRRKDEILDSVRDIDPLLARAGGGPRDLTVRRLESPTLGTFLAVHLILDVCDAMGANVLNTALEKIAPRVAEISGGRVHLRILSNLADRRLATATCTIPLQALAFEGYTAETVRDGILEAWAFAEADPYRAATHNKGIMNGVDAVVIATGNDWRAVEAGAHAYAARDGRYTSLSKWWQDDRGNLCGKLEMPMAVGIVGGATRVHPTARTALQLMQVKSAVELAGIIVSVGLAQNLAALRALATEGIQRGHMSLHARQVAVAAGAKGDEIEKLARQMVLEKIIRADRALEILNEWRK